MPVVGVVAALTLLLGACSSSGSSPSPAAVDNVAAASDDLHLSSEARACLVEGFDSNSKARGAINGTKELSADQRDAIEAVVDACIPPNEMAKVLATEITASIPPSDAPKAAAQEACLEQAILALDAPSRQALVVGLLVVRTSPVDGDLALERGDAVNNILASCSVTVSR